MLDEAREQHAPRAKTGEQAKARTGKSSLREPLLVAYERVRGCTGKKRRVRDSIEGFKTQQDSERHVRGRERPGEAL